MGPQTAAPPVVRPQPRRRWWWVALKFIAGALFAAILSMLGGWWWTHRSMEVVWDESVKEADADLPRWRLLELEEDRPNIPDAENSAFVMIEMRKKAGNVRVHAAEGYDDIMRHVPPAARLNEQQRGLLEKELAKLKESRVAMRKLKDMPRGRFPIKYTDDYISTLLPEHQGARDVGGWLMHDAMLLADDERYDEAVESCQAIINVGRVFEGDPFLVCHLIRIALQHIAATNLERVLAQGKSSEKTLQEIQATLERETKELGWLAAIRGERAGHHHLFDNIRVGKVRLSAMSRAAGQTRSFEEWLLDTLPALMIKHYPEHLKIMNNAVEISKLPIHERGAKLDEFNQKVMNEMKDKRNTVTGLMYPALVKVHSAEVRSQALLRSAAVALACERYRLKHKDNKNENAWPASLDLLVKDKLIEAIPLDPIDGQPIRYRKTKDGIVVYSIGFDKKDDQGHIDQDRAPTDSGMDIGFRLWNVDRRRQPALPPVKLPDGENP